MRACICERARDTNLHDETCTLSARIIATAALARLCMGDINPWCCILQANLVWAAVLATYGALMSQRFFGHVAKHERTLEYCLAVF